MPLNLENLTADEAYERWTWCKEAAKQLKELSPGKVRLWWKNECVRPGWLRCRSTPGEKAHQFADRLERETNQWAEAAIALYDEEDAVEREKRDEVRRLLEEELDRKRGFLEVVRLCQSVPASDRVLRGTLRSHDYYGVKVLQHEDGRQELLIAQDCHRRSGIVYLLSRSDGWCKIGCTERTIRERTREITRGWRRSLKQRFSTTMLVSYPTADRFKLEGALHFHFQGCRVKGKGELFVLLPDEVSSFRETVAKVESLVLAAEAAQLELEIMEIEAALKRAEAT